jgi:chromosome segregation ATPase
MERKFRTANAKLQEAEQRADSVSGSSKGSTEQIETLKDEVGKCFSLFDSSHCGSAQVAQLKRQLTALRGGSAAAEDSVSGLRKEKEKVEEAARQAETLVAGLKSKLGAAEQRADEAEAKRKDLQKRADELAIAKEDLERKLRAERAANQDATGSSSTGDAKVKRLEEEITKLEAKNNSAQARILDLGRQLETLEAGKGKTGNENTGKEKELEIKVCGLRAVAISHKIV